MSDVFWATQERTQMGLHVGLVMRRSLKCCLCLISRVHGVELRRTLSHQKTWREACPVVERNSGGCGLSCQEKGVFLILSFNLLRKL